ncbi:MAG TPA: peptidase M16 [Anaerolineae bacterium]|nr:peptidase M16 [Anaerolineae bacterium]
MSKYHGFELVEARDIPEINSRVRLFRHIKTGARLISVENDDENKVFGIGFRTPPSDSTGVAHILEHVVLAGSRKYRVKEPFVELLKGSLNTFLNAMTWPDRTIYPVASTNTKDFYNLIDVYLDAVFYPLLRPLTFRQEGWHFEIDDEGNLSYKGVVFNEMKGAYSSPDNVLYRTIQQSLFPDTTYGLDSGGDPRHIPDLTYEQFKAFHDAYYHPANAWIFFYGNDKPKKRLKIMNKWLRDFGPQKVDSHVPLQSRWNEPKVMRVPYIAGEDGKAFVTVNWLWSEVADPEEALAQEVLNHILMGTPASPLRKALIDSGLGEDIAGYGLDDDLRQSFFAAGLKGTEEDQAEAIEKVIFDTLTQLAEEGIDPKTVEASLNTIEFQLREMNTGRYPRGLFLYMRTLPFWIYDHDPFAAIAFENPLEAIKAKALNGGGYFESMIRRYLLDNPHRVRLTLFPDPKLKEDLEAKEQERLAREKARLTEQELQRIREEMEALHQLQETPDDPEALAAIPRLKLKDLDKTVPTIPIDVSELAGGRLLYHDLATNGILYLDVGLDLSVLPADLLPYVPLYARALVDMGNEDEDFVSLRQRIGAKTGGITTEPLLVSALDGQPVTWLFVRGKAMMHQVDDLAGIVRDILTKTQLDDPDRFRQIVLEEKARQEASLVPMGHMVVHNRLKAHFSLAGWAEEQMAGVSYLFFLRALAERLEKDWPQVLTDLRRVNDLLVNRGRMVWNVTLDEANWQGARSAIENLAAAIPVREATSTSWQPDPMPEREALLIPAQVNYVGKGGSLYALGYELDGSAFAINAFLRTTWLWEQVRMKGGAYGGFSLFDHRTGLFDYLSYRDPNLLNTLRVYDQTADFLRQVALPKDEIVKSIIGAVSRKDPYLLPDARGWTSMVRYFTGEDDAYRQRLHDQLLETSEADFRAFADVLAELNRTAHIVVMGAEAKVEEANAELTPPLTKTQVL